MLLVERHIELAAHVRQYEARNVKTARKEGVRIINEP